MRTRIVSLVVLLGLAATLPAQDDALRRLTLKDLSFIAGHWRGEAGGSAVEEQWSQPLGDNMMGMFRWMKGDAGRMYEFMTIQQTAEGPVLWMRHFSPRLVGWEEQDAALEWRLATFEPNHASFAQVGTTTRLIFRRDGDQLKVTLDKEQDGKRVPLGFRYERVR